MTKRFCLLAMLCFVLPIVARAAGTRLSIDNYVGASNRTASGATVWGSVTSTNHNLVQTNIFFYGTTNGTNVPASWGASVTNVAFQGTGHLSTDLTLPSNSSWWYTFSVLDNSGQVFATPSVHFVVPPGTVSTNKFGPFEVVVDTNGIGAHVDLPGIDSSFTVNGSALGGGPGGGISGTNNILYHDTVIGGIMSNTAVSNLTFLGNVPITNGHVTASVTNGLPTIAITNGLPTIAITNGLPTIAVTNGLAPTGYVDSATNALASAAHSELVSASGVLANVVSPPFTNAPGSGTSLFAGQTGGTNYIRNITVDDPGMGSFSATDPYTVSLHLANFIKSGSPASIASLTVQNSSGGTYFALRDVTDNQGVQTDIGPGGETVSGIVGTEKLVFTNFASVTIPANVPFSAMGGVVSNSISLNGLAHSNLVSRSCTFYVDKSGDDANPGTLTEPFSSVTQAFIAVSSNALFDTQVQMTGYSGTGMNINKNLTNATITILGTTKFWSVGPQTNADQLVIPSVVNKSNATASLFAALSTNGFPSQIGCSTSSATEVDLVFSASNALVTVSGSYTSYQNAGISFNRNKLYVGPSFTINVGSGSYTQDVGISAIPFINLIGNGRDVVSIIHTGLDSSSVFTFQTNTSVKGLSIINTNTMSGNAFKSGNDFRAQDCFFAGVTDTYIPTDSQSQTQTFVNCTLFSKSWDNSNPLQAAGTLCLYKFYNTDFVSPGITNNVNPTHNLYCTGGRTELYSCRFFAENGTNGTACIYATNANTVVAIFGSSLVCTSGLTGGSPFVLDAGGGARIDVYGSETNGNVNGNVIFH